MLFKTETACDYKGKVTFIYLGNWFHERGFKFCKEHFPIEKTPYRNLSSSRSVIFNLFHLIAQINSSPKFCDPKQVLYILPI